MDNSLRWLKLSNKNLSHKLKMKKGKGKGVFYVRFRTLEGGGCPLERH